MLAIAIAYGRLEPRNLARKRTDISYWRRAKWRSLFECEAVEYESRTDHTGDQRIALAWHCALPDASRYDRMSRYGYVGLIGGDAGTKVITVRLDSSDSGVSSLPPSSSLTDAGPCHSQTSSASTLCQALASPSGSRK